MLAVCLHELCPQDNFEHAFRRLGKCAQSAPPVGGKSLRGGSQMASGSLWEGSWAPGGPHVAAKAAQKLNLGGPGALLGRSCCRLEASWAAPWAAWPSRQVPQELSRGARGGSRRRFWELFLRSAWGAWEFVDFRLLLLHFCCF